MENETSKRQKLIELANSEFAPVVVELLKEVINQQPQILVGENEYQTVVNAVKLDTQGNIITGVVDYLEELRKGTIFNV